MNAARIMFCLTILLTAPIECFVARDLIMSTLLERKTNEDGSFTGTNNFLPKIIVTFSLVIATCLISFSTDCLSIVLEFNVRVKCVKHFYFLFFFKSKIELNFPFIYLGSVCRYPVSVHSSSNLLLTSGAQPVEILA